MKTIKLLLLFFSIPLGVYAQSPPIKKCNFDEHIKEIHSKAPNYLKKFEERITYSTKSEDFERKLVDKIYKIPIIFHIIYAKGEAVGEGNNIPYTQILSQLEVLNEDFSRENKDAINTPKDFVSVAANFNIRFVLATHDEKGNSLEEIGVKRYELYPDGELTFDYTDFVKKLTYWDPKKYLNVWVISLKDLDLLGSASFPLIKEAIDLGLIFPPFEDGIDLHTLATGSNYTSFGTFTLSKKFSRGRTLTHEVGHWLGLFHTWGVCYVSECSTDDYCYVDDFCEDTPLSGSTYQDINFDCNSFSTSCEWRSGENPIQNMFQNYMTYANDQCMNLFTQDQKKRAIAVLETVRKDIVIPMIDAPTKLSVSFNQKDQKIEFSWVDNSDNEKEFRIYLYDPKGKTYTLLAIVPLNTEFYQDTNFFPKNQDEVSYFVIKANNEIYDSRDSNVAVLTWEELLPKKVEMVSVFPNPSGLDEVYIMLNSVLGGEYFFYLFDYLGNLQREVVINKKRDRVVRLPLEQLSAGVYLLRMKRDESMSMKKIIIH